MKDRAPQALGPDLSHPNAMLLVSIAECFPGGVPMPSASSPRQGVRRLRAPRSRRRMLGGVRAVAADDPPRRQEVLIRIAVPERIVRMVEFGLEGLSDSSRGWWRRVEREVGEFVVAQLPSGAADVSIGLNSEDLEIVLEYSQAVGMA